ncbi:MAG: cobalamin-binding protein [Sphingomonadales bacterium]|nr:cobalamin-binding protein [Sphingomonadales bacterium]
MRFPPQRIVSLVPSQTECLAALGLDQEVVGITRFCVHPPHWRQTKIRVGGTKDFRVEQILALRPDWVLANKEENDQDRLEQLMKELPVWISDVRCIDSACAMMDAVGRITGRTEQALALTQQIQAGFEGLGQPLTGRRVLYGIWRDPWMFAGSDTFIDAVLTRLGAVNAAASWTGRYPTPEPTQLQASGADLLLLSSEPFPFRRHHAQELFDLGLARAELRLVDGEHYSWYGPRLLAALEHWSVSMG